MHNMTGKKKIPLTTHLRLINLYYKSIHMYELNQIPITLPGTMTQ